MKNKFIIFLILLLIFLAFSPAYATLAKQVITPDNWDINELADAIMWPDSIGGFTFFESYEPTGYYNSSTEYINGTGSTLDEDYTSVAHTGFGSQVLRSHTAAVTGSYAYAKTIFSPSPVPYMTSSVTRVWFYIDDFASSGVRHAFALVSGSTILARMTVTTSAINLAVNEAGTFVGASGVACAGDTWHYLDIYFNGVTQVCKIRLDGVEKVSSTNAYSMSLDTIYAGFYATNVATSGTILFDDILIRSGTEDYIGDLNVLGILTDASDSTYWQGHGATTQSAPFSMTDIANPSPGNVKLLRMWSRAEQYSTTDYQLHLGLRDTVNNDTDYQKYNATGSWKDVFAQWDLDPHTGAVWDYTGINATDGVIASAGVSDSEAGNKVSKLWGEVVTGSTGDAILTHGPYFGGVKSDTIKAWVRVNEETNVALCYSSTEADAKQCNLACTASTVPYACCTGYTTGTCAGTATSPATVTSTTNFTNIFTVSSLTTNTKYYFDVLVQQEDGANDSYKSMYAFETTALANPYWANLPYCTTFIADGATDNFIWAGAGDMHEQPSHWQIWASMAGKTPRFFFDFGDQVYSDDITFTALTAITDLRNDILGKRRGFNVDSVNFFENIASKMPVVRIPSDHDSITAMNNNNKVGTGYFGYTLSYRPGWKGWQVYLENQPTYDLPVPTNYTASVTTADATGLMFKTTTTVPVTGLNGIYGGMVLHNKTDGSWGIVRNVVAGTPNIVYLTQVLAGGTENDFDSSDAIEIQRGFLGYKFTYGDSDFVVGDLRSKRDPNLTYGADKTDGTSFPFFSKTAASALSKDITCGDSSCAGTLDFNDYAIAATGTTTTDIKHLLTAVTTETTKWDLVCAWTSAEVFRECSLILASTNAPPPTIFAQDGFDVAADTFLENRTDEQGHAWKRHPSYSSRAMLAESTGDYARANSTLSVAKYYVEGTSSTEEYDVQASLLDTGNTNYRTGLCGRVNTASDTMYCTYFDGGANVWYLIKLVNGVSTTLKSCTVASTCPGTDIYNAAKTVKLTLRGTTSTDLKVYIGGVEQTALTQTDSSSPITAKGYPGIQGQGSTGAVGAHIDNFVATNASSESYGDITLEWEIPGLIATDYVRFFESGASSWGCVSYPDNCADVNHGHVQRTFLQIGLRDSVRSWRNFIVETPLLSKEIMQGDKWGDYDGMSAWNQKWLGDLSADDGVCSGATEQCFLAGYTEKPGGVQRPIVDSGATVQAALVEVANKVDLDNSNEWWYDAPNDRIYIYGNEAIVACGSPPCSPNNVGVIMVVKPEFWRYSALRKYIIEQYSNLNVIAFGADRHIAALSNTYVYGSTVTDDSWPYVLAGPLHVRDGASHNSGKGWLVDGKYSWYDRGMGPDSGDPYRIGGFMTSTVAPLVTTITMYERDGNIINNSIGATRESWFDPTSANWLGNMTMQIMYNCGGCLLGGCDYFNRTDREDLGDCFVEDNTYLKISSNAVIADSANTGIAHFNDPNGATQYAQIKITSTSTDGDAGMILRSETSSGNRYALVYDEGSTLLKWQRYNWVTYTDQVDSETVNLADNTWLSAIITGTGASTKIDVWVNTSQPSIYPYSSTRWNDTDDAPDYTLTCSGTCAADTGTYAGIIIKKETGVASPTLDDFYSGDVSLAGAVYSGKGLFRGVTRGVCR